MRLLKKKYEDLVHQTTNNSYSLSRICGVRVGNWVRLITMVVTTQVCSFVVRIKVSPPIKMECYGCW